MKTLPKIILYLIKTLFLELFFILIYFDFGET